MTSFQTSPDNRPHTHTAESTQASDGALDPEVINRSAQVLRWDLFPAYIWGIQRDAGLAEISIEAVRKYVDDYVLDATGSDCRSQPLLRSLLEQSLLLHQTIGRLHGDGLKAATIEDRRQNLQLAASLIGELRRLAQEIDRFVQSRRKAAVPFPEAKKGKTGGGKNKVVSKTHVA